MSCQNYFGDQLQSLPTDFVAGKPNMQVKLDFLSSAIDNMSFAAVDEGWLHLVMPNATVAAGETCRGDLPWQMVDSITFKDVYDERIVCQMTSMRDIAQKALGERFFDPPDVTNGGGAPLAMPLSLWMPFCIFRPDGLTNTPYRFRTPAYDVMKGKYQVTFGPSVLGTGAGNRMTVGAGAYIELWFDVVDIYSLKRTPMRAIIKDILIGKSEDEYVLPKERPMLLSWFAGQGNENNPAGVSPWAAQQFTSRTWQFTDITNEKFAQQYLRNRRAVRTPDRAGAAAAEDNVLVGTSVPLFTSREDQPPGNLPNVTQNLHLKTSLTFGAGNFTDANQPYLIRMSLVDDPSLSGDACSGKGAYAGAVVGDVESPEGTPVPITPSATHPGVPASLVAKLSRKITTAGAPPKMASNPASRR